MYLAMQTKNNAVLTERLQTTCLRAGTHRQREDMRRMHWWKRLLRR
ncbi:hypothetical protein HYR99_07235 [Candidatus Poribacteria bacterium]|nr:hypothetical protein [Candidatus Poribacteria bacterium]